MRRMQRQAGYSPLRRLFRVILAVADYRMAKRRKLHPNLVLQPGHQSHSHQRSTAKAAFDHVVKLGTSRFRIILASLLLKHSFAPKVVNQRALLGGEMATNHGQILPHWRVVEKLADQKVAVSFGLCEQQNSGSETIDAVHHKGALLALYQFCGKQRPGGGRIRTLWRHRRQTWGLVESYYVVIFVKDGDFAGEADLLFMLPSPAAAFRSMSFHSRSSRGGIRASCAITAA